MITFEYNEYRYLILTRSILIDGGIKNEIYYSLNLFTYDKKYINKKDIDIRTINEDILILSEDENYCDYYIKMREFSLVLGKISKGEYRVIKNRYGNSDEIINIY